MSGETTSAYTDPMVVCPSCGTENPDRARFCLECGVSLEPSPTPGRGTEARHGPVRRCGRLDGARRRLDPEALKDVLARFFAAMREQIEAEGGTVEKFIGDAVMAAFGVPAAHEDDPARALRAALRMQRRLGDLNHELEAAHGIELGLRIGVNTARCSPAHSAQVGRGDGDRRRGQHGGPAPASRRARPDPRRRPHRGRGARIRPRAGGSPRCARKVHPCRRDDPRGRA